MSCYVPREGIPRRFRVLPLVLTILAVFWLFPVQSALALTAATVGDFDNVTVMQVSGSYDVGYINGSPDMAARRDIAREFYRTHGDDYDFLVIFTNFDFIMPPGAKAFFSPARNDVRGIGVSLNGQELYDYTSAYSPTGTPLARLNGTIDMANIASHVLEPAVPEFDDTLTVLTHEFLHRWGAYVHFKDGATDSTALLGLGDAHWSYLFDSQGSTLYGNRWRDNGDGTFTAIAPEQIRDGEVIGRLFSPLDLYLMGFVDKTKVPPLLLIDAPGIDRNQLPAIGDTIPGTARTVTIDDIIAAQGERVPAAAETRKEFRVAFIYAVTPGTWSAGDAQDRGEVAAINRLQAEWEKRFSILTDGTAMMRTSLVVPEAAATNPGVTVSTGAPAVTPSVNNGVAWLVGRQQPGGYWQDQPGTDRRDTAAAVTALKTFPAGLSAAAVGEAWLGTMTSENSDFAARKLLGLTSASVSELVDLQNPDGGWGSAPGYASDPLDTALVLQALATRGGVAAGVIAAAVNYQQGKQNPDGGWNAGSGGSLVQPTARALLALNSQRGSYPLEPVVADGLAWLAAKQNGDGGFGNSPSTFIDTALALQALKAAGSAPAAATSAIKYLLAKQDNSGSWNGSVFQTAQAVEALYAGQVVADLAVATSDIGFNPVIVSSLPSPVTVTVTVRNLGSNAASAVKVALYENDPTQGGLLGEKTVSVPGNGSVPAIFSVTVASAGLHAYHVVVDGDREVAEANEWNNMASKTLAANMAPPTVGFTQASSAGSEAVTTVPLAVTLGYPWPEPITVSYAANASGTATPAADYVLAAGTLTFAADETSKTITLAVVNDLVAESDETVIVDLSNPTFGTLGTSRHSYTIRDDEAPAVTITSPPAGVIGQSAPQLLYTSTGGNVVVKVDGSVIGKVSGNTLGPFTDGAHAVEVSAGNSFGLTTTARVDFTVDTTVPTVIINAPKGVQTTRTPLLDYLVDGAATVVVRVDNVAVNKVSGETLDPLAEGSHTLTVTATNATGRSNSATSTFLVDTIPPSVALRYPYDGGIIEEAAPQLLYTLGKTGTVNVRVDGAVVAKVSGDRLAPLGDGEHSVAVTLTDGNGVSAMASATFVVELDSEPARVTDPAWAPPSSVDLWPGSKVAVDREGNVYLAGLTGGGGYDLFIAKYGRNGAKIWSFVPIVANLEPNASAMGVDDAGNMYVAFTSFDPIGGYTAKAGRDVYLAKFDSSGTRTGLIQIASSYDDYVYDMIVTGSGDIYVAGITGGSLFSGSSGGYSTWVAKYNRNLARQWGGQQSHYSYYEPGNCFLALGHDGTVYVGGEIQGRFANSGNQVGLYDYYIARWGSGGDYIGSVQSGTDQNEDVYGLGTDNFGSVYLLGATTGAFSGYANLGASDFFLVKYDAGQLQWARQWGTAGVDEPASLEVEPDGDLYVVEYRTLTKFNRDKNQIWTSQKLTANGFDTGGSTIDGRGSVFAIYNGSVGSSIYKYSDPRLPAITLTAASLTSQAFIAIQGTRSADVEVFVSTDTGAACDSIQFPTATSWACTLTGLKEGGNTIQVVARTPEGFRNSVLAMTGRDTVPPDLVLTTPAEGATYTTKPTPSYSAPGATATGYLNGQPVDQLNLPLQGLLPGQNVFRLDAVDPAGNVSTKQVTFFAMGAAIGETAYPIDTPSQFGTAADEEVDQILIDSGSNIYVTGTTFGSLYGVTNSGQGDVFVNKYDSTGNRLWTRLYGTPDTEYGRGIGVDAAGNLYLVWDVLYAGVKGSSQNWSDIRQAKYDTNHTLLWSNLISSKGRDSAGGLAVDRNGYLWAGGTLYGSLDRLVLAGASDAFLRGSDYNGTQTYMSTGVAGDDTVTAVSYDSRNTLVYYTGRQDGVPYIACHNIGNGIGTPHYSFYAAPATGESHDLTTDAVGNVYVVGQIDLGQGGGADAFLVKNPASSNPARKQFGTTGTDVAKGVAVDSAGNVYVAGYTDGAFPGQTSSGGHDVFVAKFNSNLQLLWTKQFGTAADDEAVDIAVDSLGNLIVAGQTTGDLGSANAGGKDGFLVKITKPTGPTLSVNPVTTPTRLATQVISGTVSLPATMNVSHDPSITSSGFVTNLDGTWSFMVSDLVANADNVLTISATDSSGTTTRTVIITVDTLSPSLAVTPVISPTRTVTQTVTGTIETGTTLTVEVNPPSTAVPVPVANGTWSYTASLVAGFNTLIFTATDAAGNASGRTVTIDCRPPRLTVTPTTVVQGTAAPVTLTIEQFDPAVPTIQVKLIQDVAGDGSPVADPLARLFFVQDGVASGNPNVPGDEDGQVDGRIVTALPNAYLHDVAMAPGDYVVMACTYPATVTAPLRVEAASQPQTIQGYVLDPQGEPLSGATVQLLDKWGQGHGYAFTDSTGHYLFNVPSPGEYVLLPTRESFAFAKADLMPRLLSAGQQLTVDLPMAAGTCKVDGQVRDATSSGQVAGGVLVRAENGQYVAAPMPRVYGSYSIDLPAGEYQLFADAYTTQGAAAQGYLGAYAPLGQVTAAAASTGNHLQLGKATALVCGEVRDSAGLGVAGLVVKAATDGVSGRFASAVTDGDGNYCLGLMDDGIWRITLNDAADQPLGYVGTAVPGVTSTGGPFSGVDLTVYLVEAAIGGNVKEGIQPVAGMTVKATCAATGATVSGQTAGDGSYRLRVPAGTWQLTLAAGELGYAPVATVSIQVVAGDAAARNFAVTRPVEPVAVTVNPVTSPTGQPSQTIGGSCSTNAMVTVAVNTVAVVGAVSYPTATTWQCTVSSLVQGPNAITVTATDGKTQTTVSTMIIDYQPPVMTNTIGIIKAAYDTRKKVLTVEATSHNQNANLEVVGYGPMTFARLSKGKYYWNFSRAMATKPAAVTVSGPEGSKTAAVQ